MWRVYLLSGLIACVAGATTAFVTVQLTAPARPHTETIVLDGEEHLEMGQERVVYFKTPFTAPPYLTIARHDGSYEITDQKAESFKIKRPKCQSWEPDCKLKWKAEGRPAK